MTPGRIRLALPALLNQPDNAEFARESYSQLTGVTDVRASAITGSLTVAYDVARTSLAAIIHLLYTMPLHGEAVRSVRPKARCAAPPREAEGGLPLKWQIIGVAATGALLALLAFPRFFGRFLPFVSRIPVNPVASVAAVLSGVPVFKEGVGTMLEERRLSLDFLVSVAAAIGISIGQGLVALEALWLVNCGTVLENWTEERSRRSIRELLDVGEDEVWLERDGDVVRVPIEQIETGNVVVVHAGEKIAVDGEVAGGEAAVNEAPITGESLPVAKAVGARVFAGTLVNRGTLRVVVENVGDTTYLARVLQMVEESLEARAPIERVSDQFAHWFVPAAFLASLLVYLVTRNFLRAFTVLVTSCPCAAAIATPTAVSAAVGNAARRGMLVKGGAFIEQASRIDTVCLDKTGTLTVGRPTVATVIPLSGRYGDDDLIRLAASAEARSFHPLAHALSEEAMLRGIAIIPTVSFEPVAGSGIVAELVVGSKVLVGSARLMEAHRIAIDTVDGHAVRMRQAGETLLFVAVDGELAGLIGVLDAPRPEAAQVVRACHDAGMTVHLLTGDHHRTGASISRQLGIRHFECDMLPEDKAARIDALRAEGHTVAMVGDGVNDTLALARADLGIAMGAGGSDVAVETADIALAADDLSRLPALRTLSKKTMAVIWQNYAYSMGVNALGIGLGSAGLISPLMGGMLHVANSLGVIINSSRLLFLTDSPGGPRPGAPYTA